MANLLRFSVYTASPARETREDGQAAERQPSPVRAPASKAFFRPGRMFRSQSSQNLREGGRSSSPGFSSRANDITDDLNTLPDPRYSTDSPTGTRTPERPQSFRAEESDELSQLSIKLINSINHQTLLDDNLQKTRHELEAARDQVSRLERTVRKHEELVSRGFLVEKIQTDSVEEKLRGELAEERAQRLAAERSRKAMELELESLTSNLFEEANTMVADARRENANAEKRSEQLKLQLSDSEVLLASHQQQLRELKSMLEQIQQERDETESSTTSQTPVTASRESLHRSFDIQRQPSPALALQPVAIDQPLRFTQLIRPVLRSDLPAYEEFITIVQTAVKTSPSSRVNSGGFGGALNAIGMNSSTGAGSPARSSTPVSGNTSMAPTLPGSFNTPNSPTSDATSLNPATTLDKSKFYKRILSEDIEPTLRLDAAPGLSFFARRTVVNSMMSGAFIIEPWPPGSRWHSPALACSLCGEVRKGEPYIRRHRFRTSDSDDSQRYPLCAPCLEKVRSTCELVGFLKLLRNGQIWRADSDLEEARLARMAWEDCVRLRERMFWARVGGGVVPVYRSEEPTSAVSTTAPTGLGDAAEGPPLPPRTSLASVPEGVAGDASVEGGEGVSTPVVPGLTHQESTSSEAEGGDTFVDATETPAALPGSSVPPALVMNAPVEDNDRGVLETTVTQ